MNGYHTQIFELHDKPGGLCTSWKRRGYTFDGCIHWLVGSGEGSTFNHIWQELGAVQGREMVDHEEFTRVVGANGETFIVYTDVDRLEQHMKELAPADAGPIEELCNAVRRFTRFDEVMGVRGPGPLQRIATFLKMVPFIGPLRKYSKTRVQDFAARFSDPFLRQAFGALFDLPDFPMLGVVMTLAWMDNRDAGYPIGGSLAFARAIEQRYLGLGGEIHYNSRVERVLVEGDRAVGVRLADGTEHRADVVVSAADGHATIFEMLEGRYVDDEILRTYEEWPIFQPIIQVSLGVARDLSDEPHSIAYLLDEPITVAGEARSRLSVKHYCYDPTLAPAGKSAVVVIFESNHAYWQELAEERERYDAEKQEIALTVMDQLEQRWPGISEEVEVADVATPLTYERYTGNWQGSMEGWMLTTERAGAMMGQGMDQTLPGLKGFYMAGQWVEPGGGVPTAAWSGRKAMRAICKEYGRPFVAEAPPA
jgi:phytoene dehydrogenase-like protein